MSPVPTIKQSIDAGEPPEKVSQDIGFGQPWYVKLVQSQGVANVILLLIAVTIIPATAVWIKSAANDTDTQAKEIVAQTEVLRQLGKDFAALTERQTTIIGMGHDILANQKQLDKIADAIDKLVELERERNRTTAASASAQPEPAKKST